MNRITTKKMKKVGIIALVAVLLFTTIPLESLFASPMEPVADATEPTEPNIYGFNEFINNNDTEFSEEWYDEAETPATNDVPHEPVEATQTNDNNAPLTDVNRPDNTTRSQGQLTLNWQANNNDPHLALDPASNTRQAHVMELNFSPVSNNTYAPGDIEIRLPRALFEDRDGNLILTVAPETGPGSQTSALAPMEVPLPGNTDFNFTIDEATQEIVITNFREVGGESHLNIQFRINYFPSQSANGFRNDNIYARATFAEAHSRDPLESNSISLELTTRVVPVNPTKTVDRSHSVWQNRWGERPANADNYFFVVYRVISGFQHTTTQPFTSQLIETPLDGGEIVAWTNIAANQTTLTNFIAGTNWTRGDTTAFNAAALNHFSVPTPQTPSSVGRTDRFQAVVVMYPRTGEPDQVVCNSAEVVITPIDDDEIRLSAEACYTYNTVGFVYQEDYFGISKQMGTSSSTPRNGALTIFEEEGIPYRTNSNIVTAVSANFVSVVSRGFSFTENGTRPFQTTVIDDHMYLETTTGFHELTPEDFRFTRVAIGGYTERVPVRDGNENVIDTVLLPNSQRSPIRFYYQVAGNSEWQYLTTWHPTTGNSPWFNLPNADVHRIKAVHDNGLYEVNFRLHFDYQINPTPRVLSLIEGQQTVRLRNFAALIVEDDEGNHLNPVGEETYVGSMGGHFANRDREQYGHLVQRATDDTILDRITFTTTIHKVVREGTSDAAINAGATGIQSQPDHARVRIPYRVVIQHNTAGPRLSNENFHRFLPEQTHGTFYDLLPLGTILNPATIVARDIHNRVVSHTLETVENWQGSGRTLVIINVYATAGENLRNNGSVSVTNISGNASWNTTSTFGGTGFVVDFDVYYPWMNIGLFGGNLRNLVTYRSGNGEFLGGNRHTDGQNTAPGLTDTERELMANFPGGASFDPEERNSISTVRPDTVAPITADQIGMRKLVRAAGDTDYSMSTSVRPGGAYSYRLQYIGPSDHRTTNLVMFDVLEVAHEGRPYWQGNLESIDLSHPRLIGADPVVYYSTQSGLSPMDNAAHADLSNTAIWSTTPPSDLADVTAVAFDFGTFVFEPGSGVVVTLHMRAPHDYTLYNNIAYNRAQYRITTIPITGGDPINWPIAEVPYTQVTLSPRDVAITKGSNPASGTATDPTEVDMGSTVAYSIRVQNNEELTLSNVVVEDEIPPFMTFDPAELRGFFGNNPVNAIPLSQHTRVSFTVTGNRIEWTIATLAPGEAFTIIVPAVVDENLEERTVFENTARIIRIDGVDYDISSETTYHVAEPTEPTTVPATTVPTEPVTTVPTDPSEPTTVPATTVPTDPSEPTTVPATTVPTEPVTTVPTEPTTAPTDPSEVTTAPTEATTAPTDPSLEDPEITKDVCALDASEVAPSFWRFLTGLEQETCVAPEPVVVGEYVEYVLVVSNPNDVNLYDFLVIDNLANGDLEGVRNITVTPDVGYSVEETEYELRILLDYLPANGSVTIRFEARVAEGVEPGEVINTVHLYEYDRETSDRTFVGEDDAIIIIIEDEDPTEPTTAPATTVPTEPTTAPTDPSEPTTVPATTIPTEPVTTVPTEPTTAPTDPSEVTTAPTEATTAPTDPSLEDPEITKDVCALDASEVAPSFWRQLLGLEEETCVAPEPVVVGEYVEYVLVVSNPNDVNLYDFLVIDNLANGDLEGVRNITVTPDVGYIVEETGYELRILLDYLPAGGSVTIRFEARVAEGVEPGEVINTVHLYEYDRETSDRTFVGEDDAIIIIIEDEDPTEPTTAPATTVPTEPVTTAPTDPSEPTTVPATTIPTEPVTTDPSEPTTVPATTVPTEPVTTVPTEPTTAPTDPSEVTTAPTEPTTAPTDPSLEDPEITKDVCALDTSEVAPSFWRQLLGLEQETCVAPEPVVVGEYVEYVLVVSNPNDVNLYDFLVVDNLANGDLEGVRNITVTPDVGYSVEETGYELRILLDYLPAGGSVTIRFEARVAEGVEPGEVINTVHLYEYDRETGDRTFVGEDDAIIIIEDEDPTEPAPTTPTDPSLEDPEITKDVCVLDASEAAPTLGLEEETCVTPDLVVVGEYVEYVLVVSNPNDVNLYDFLVVDNLANGDLEGVRNITVTPDVGYSIEETEYELRILLDYLPAGGSVTIRFEARVAEGVEPGEVINTVHLYEYDRETGDRTFVGEDDAIIIIIEDEDSTEPTEPKPTAPALDDPTLEKVANVRTAQVGDIIEYRLTVNNPNDETLLGEFVVIDVLNLDLVTFIPGSVRVNGDLFDYEFNQETGELRVYLNDLLPGDTNITFEVTVLEEAAGTTIPNTAVLEGPEDPETGNRPGIDEDDEDVVIEEESTTPTDPWVCDDTIYVIVDSDGNITVIAPPGIDYEIVRDENGNIHIVLPPGWEDCVVVILPDDEWEYDVESDDDGNSVIVVRPPAIPTTRPEDCDEEDNHGNNGRPTGTRPGGRPTLPQTGAIVGTSLLSGIGFSIAGLTLAKRKKKQDS